MEESATTDAANKNGDDGGDAVALAVRNTTLVQVPLPPYFLPVLIPYEG